MRRLVGTGAAAFAVAVLPSADWFRHPAMAARTMRCAAAVALLVLLAVGCASGTKSGGTASHQIRLVMQSAGGSDTNSTYFISQVQKRSGGRIQIVLGSAYPNSDIRNEPRLVRALRRGKVQMAYISSRAWEEASPVTAFRALQAPLLVTSYPLLRRITAGPVGRSMLESLNSIGVVGLGLVPERLRRLLGRTPLDSAATLRGARIRPVTSLTGEMALRALGAVPVEIASSRAAGPAMVSGRIDGVETETISIEHNNYMNYAHDLTANIALFAKTTTFAIRKSVFDRLSARDRSILSAAAEATAAQADPAAAERPDMKQLCKQGIKLVTATPADLASLERLALPAYTTLERDATTRSEIKAIERLKKTTPGGVSKLPACPGSKGGSPSQPVANNTLVAGTYVMSASKSEIDSAPGHAQGASDNWGSFRLVLRGKRFRISDQRLAGQLVQGYSSGLTSGTYSIRANRLTFVIRNGYGDTPLGILGDTPIAVHWSLYRHALTFRQLFKSEGPPLLFVKPWQCIGGGR